jgi:hypothetical protein
MEENDRLKALEDKIDMMSVSVEKIRKYFLYSLIATIVFFVLPLIGLVFAVPMLMSTIGTMYSL